MKYIVTNFAYGTGPYLRTTELVLAINAELESRGQNRLGVIVPWVYGDKQKRIMLEEFGEFEAKYPGEILLDTELGGLLKSIFYGDNTYEEALKLWVENCESISEAARRHLSGNIEVENLSGEKIQINGADIVMEINRAPRIFYNVAPSYYTTFGHISEILKNVLEVPKNIIDVDRDLIKKAIPVAEKLEANNKLHFVAEPGTFSYVSDRRPLYAMEQAAPPIARPPRPNDDEIENGIFVTITGIPGLERLYAEAQKLGLKLYSNDTKAVLGSEKLLPHVIPNANIKLQFARSGWGSVWLSMLAGTPFVTPEFDPKDDPEIYFNNLCIEKLGLGVIYRGQPLEEILAEAESLKPKIQAMNQSLMERFGTYDGNQFCAKLIVEDFIKNDTK